MHLSGGSKNELNHNLIRNGWDRDSWRVLRCQCIWYNGAVWRFFCLVRAHLRTWTPPPDISLVGWVRCPRLRSRALLGFRSTAGKCKKMERCRPVRGWRGLYSRSADLSHRCSRISLYNFSDTTDALCTPSTGPSNPVSHPHTPTHSP